MSEPELGRVGAKAPVSGESAVVASQHPLVTETMLEVLRSGGNAMDAGISGCLLHAVVQQDMTNHAGTVSLLYWDAATQQTYELNSMGTIVSGLAPFRPVPASGGFYTAPPGPIAVIPGFMPGLKAAFERFGTQRWDALCQPSIAAAEEGHIVDSFEHLVTAQSADIYLHSPSGREHFAPGGHFPQVGERWPKPALAATMRALADEGPDSFTSGTWGRAFVARANEMGWPITVEHMTAVAPKWGEGLRYRHGEHEIVQLSPPERTSLMCAITLGILDALDVRSLGHYTESAESLYYLAHALRRAKFETSHINDPVVFDNPTDTLLSPDYHSHLAQVIRRSRPSRDLTEHVRLAHGPNAQRAVGAQDPTRSIGSCELSVIDSQGNWLQMMNTLQGGGIPGEVVGGVSMIGSTATADLDGLLAGAWFTGGVRPRSIIAHTMVLKDGKPWLTLGSPGIPNITLPQVMTSILDHGFAPYDADDAPRIMPLENGYTVPAESRFSPQIARDLASMGVLLTPMHPYHYSMGTFQMSWKDAEGTLHASVGPRRAGRAAAY